MTSNERVGDNVLWSSEDSLEPLHDDIAKLAYELWEARGCDHGGDEQDWLEAERRLMERKAEGQSA